MIKLHCGPKQPKIQICKKESGTIFKNKNFILNINFCSVSLRRRLQELLSIKEDMLVFEVRFNLFQKLNFLTFYFILAS